MTDKRKMTVGIRADGNSAIGMGHLMRCISVAFALKERGVPCIFYTAQEAAGAFLRDRGFLCHVLHTNYQDMESELSGLEEQLQKDACAMLLVDSYQITQTYLNVLREKRPVYYFDDMGDRRLIADGIINYNIYGKDLGYETWCPPQTMLLLGPEFAPVKKPFTETPYRVREAVSRVLITMGGSDSLNIAGELGGRLLRVLPDHVGLDIICGRFNPHLEQLKKMEELESRVRILVDVQDMWNKMAEADIAVSAAGSTMYELSAMGVPSVCCYYVENQRRIAEGFAKNVQLVNGGDFSVDAERVLNNLTDEVCRLTEDADRRRALSKRMKQVTDGRGAWHLADMIRETIQQN